MLTASEIKNKKFDKSAFGYKIDDVENFLNEVIDTIAELESDKEEMQKKLVVLANKIEEYRNEEDSLRQALLGAQKLGDNILKEAKNRAEIMLRDANIKSDNIIKNIKDEAKREEVILNKMKREVDAFRTKMLTMYNSHIDMIKSIPEIEREKNQEIKEEQEKNEAPTEVVEEPTIEIEKQEVKEETKEIQEVSDTIKEEPNVKPDESNEDGFKISNGFKFSRFDEKDTIKESKFGPLKFGDDYNFDDDSNK